MKFNRFVEEVLEKLREKCSDEFTLESVSTLKNNGSIRTGIKVYKETVNMEPVIYLESYYTLYETKEKSLDEIITMLHNEIIRGLPKDNFKVREFLDWNCIKSKITYKVINKDKNKELLEDIPHRDYLDLSIVYYINVDDFFDNCNQASILIHNAHLRLWAIGEEELYVHAMSNLDEYLFRGIEDVLNEMGGIDNGIDEIEKIPMYILSNKKCIYGAKELARKDVQREIGEIIGGDYIVLPSSLHESIIIPHSPETDVKFLASMVREINDTQVDVEDILSYHVYLFSRDTDELSIVA